MVSIGIARPEQLLDRLEERLLVDAHERDRLSVDAGATGAADPVDVVLGDHRQLEVDDVRELLDVDAARGDVGRDEQVDAAGLEVVERAHPLRLALVAVDRGGADAVLLELQGEAVGAVLGAGEHERLLHAAQRDELAQEVALALAVDRDHELVDELGRGVARRDLDPGRVLEEAVGEAAHLVRVGGREQEVLAARREQREDLPDVPDEAHVEHPVRLVEDEHLDGRQVDRPLADVVEQAARRRDDDLGAGPELRDLGPDSDAAVDRRGADRPVAPVGAEALLDLDRELARRHDDEDAHAVPLLAAVATPVAWRVWMIGRTNAAVLPVPVWAPASTSRPSRTAGIAAAWTGVGIV